MNGSPPSWALPTHHTREASSFWTLLLHRTIPLNRRRSPFAPRSITVRFPCFAFQNSQRAVQTKQICWHAFFDLCVCFFLCVCLLMFVWACVARQATLTVAAQYALISSRTTGAPRSLSLRCGLPRMDIKKTF